MYLPTIPQPQTFQYHYSTQYYNPAVYVQPRVGKDGSHRTLLDSSYVYRFGLSGVILGCLILFFSFTLFATELGRLYSGSNNKGISDANGTQYLMYPELVVDFNGYWYNPKIENRWMWPWSTATLLFSLVFVTAGIFGLISGLRESYRTIVTFFICSLLSIFLMIFLIATYSTIIAGWKSYYGTYDGNQMSRYARIDRDLSAVCLAMSCVLFILFFVGMIVSGLTVDLCQRKNFFHGESNDVKQLVGT